MRAASSGQEVLMKDSILRNRIPDERDGRWWCYDNVFGFGTRKLEVQQVLSYMVFRSQDVDSFISSCSTLLGVNL